MRWKFLIILTLVRNNWMRNWRGCVLSDWLRLILRAQKILVWTWTYVILALTSHRLGVLTISLRTFYTRMVHLLGLNVLCWHRNLLVTQWRWSSISDRLMHNWLLTRILLQNIIVLGDGWLLTMITLSSQIMLQRQTTHRCHTGLLSWWIAALTRRRLS